MRVVTSTGGTALRAAFLHTDHLGSASLTTDSSGGEVARQKYYPFGAIRPGGTGTMPTDKAFTGQYADASTGLYFYNARYYSSAVGRFLSADTMVPGAGNPQAWNRYSYVKNNPLKYTDPSGHSDCPDEGPCAEGGPGGVAGGEGGTGGGSCTECPIEPVRPIGEQNGPYQRVYTDSSGRLVQVDFNGKAYINGTAEAAEESAQGYVRAVPKDQVGTSQPFKTVKGEDGLSVFENVTPEQVLKELPGERVPNTTVTIPQSGLPEGTKVIPTEANGLSQLLSEAHRILVRPDGWSVDRFAKALKILVGWGE